MLEKTVDQAGKALDPLAIAADFPILERQINGRRLVYLDNAATTQKPRTVINAISDYYRNFNANVHRGLHTLAEEATAAYEETRRKVGLFIGGVKPSEIIFTRNATESINLVAYTWAEQNLKQGDRIVTTQMEHHANLVPWLVLAKKKNLELKYIPIDGEGKLDLTDIDNIISDNTKLVAVTHMSNVLGTINQVEEIAKITHSKGSVMLVDGAQSAPHMEIDVKAIDADFYAFSSHKMMGPTGIGVLYGKESILEATQPFNFGGEMINEVRYDYVDWAELPHKFEAGTPNIAGAVGFGAAIDYLNRIGMDNIRRHEIKLTNYALSHLTKLDFLNIYGPLDPAMRGGAISFVDKQIHPHDLATFLDTKAIAIRAGHHCAQPLTNLLGVPATARASFYIYNTESEIDQLVIALKQAREYFGYE